MITRAAASTAGTRTDSQASATAGQITCFALALWNGKDPILKERLFGLTGNEGNHGEDAKEYYFYLDSTPTHSYMKMLYKYPQAEYPYSQLLEANRNRSRDLPEFELIDTGVFNEDRYFDVAVEYAKAEQNDLLIKITIDNRGPEAAQLHVLPTLWFRNTWSWGLPGSQKPLLKAIDASTVQAQHQSLPDRFLYVEGDAGTPLHRERDQLRPSLRYAEPLALCEGQHQ